MLTIWVTTACNLCCKYCYEGEEKEKSFMQHSTAVDLIEWIKSWMDEKGKRFEQIRFHGGEPLLNMPIIRYLVARLNESEYEFDYGLTTNGYLLSKENADFLAENIDELAVSIDGCKKCNDAYRVLKTGAGTFDQVFSNALYLKEKKQDIAIRMTVRADMVERLYENVVFMVDNGFNNIISALDIFDDNWTKEKMDILESQCDLLREKLSSYDNTLLDVSLPIQGKIKKRVCMGGIDGVNIAPDGTFYPCSYTVSEKLLSCGDIYTGIVNDKIKCFEEIYNTKIEACLGCTNYEYCPSTRCKFINKKRMGDYFSPIPILCAVQNRESRRYRKLHCVGTVDEE